MAEKKIPAIWNLEFSEEQVDLVARFRLCVIRFGDRFEDVLSDFARQYIAEREHLLNRGTVVSTKELMRLVQEKLGQRLSRSQLQEFRRRWAEGVWYWGMLVRKRRQYTYSLNKVWPYLVEHYRRNGYELPEDVEVPRYVDGIKSRGPAREVEPEQTDVSGFRAIGWHTAGHWGGK